MRPEAAVHLVESRRMRIEWLARMIGELELTNCHLHGAKVQAIEPVRAEIITARAFAPLTKLLPMAERFSTKGTVWLLPKGRSAAQELGDMNRKTRQMFHVEQSLTDRDAGIIVSKNARRTDKPMEEVR